MPEDVNIVVEVDSATAICANHIYEITNVAGNLGNINTVISNSSNINKVANIDDDVTKVADIDDKVSAVADNETNINAVNANKDNIDVCVTNITSITNAPAAASNAAQQAGIATSQANIATQQAALAKQYAEETHGASDVTLANLRAIPSYRGYEYPQTDAQGFADVNYYAHSNFDITKFTVVGSPIITYDGIASGFKNSKFGAGAYYVKTPSITFGKSLFIGVDFEIGNTFANGAIIGVETTIEEMGPIIINITNSREVRVLLKASDNTEILDGRFNLSSSYNFSTNTKYYLIINYNDNTYSIKIYETITNNCVFEKTVSSNKILKTGCLTLGQSVLGSSGVSMFNGSIDLKSFSIVSEGKTIFTGNKTGVDTKKSDYTPLPTSDPCPVTPDGVANGFSPTKYITSDYELTTSYSTLEIDLGEVVITELPSETATMWLFHAIETNSSINKGLWFGINGTGKSRYYAGSGDTNYDIANDKQGNITYSVGQKVKFKLAYDGTQYTLYSSINGGTWQQDGTTITSSAKINFDTTIKIGSDGSVNAFIGSVDLNHMRIITNGKVVWQPCLKIPYMLSKTGSKVVDAAYRDRIADYYEQYGYAPYYTLSDTDFTVPRGDIFGIINKLIEEATA